MNHTELKEARHTLGLSAHQITARAALNGDTNQ